MINVGANQSMEALIEVYESDIDRVQMGQAVDLISENGGFNGSLSGQVTLISPQVRQRRVLSTDPTGDADSRVVEVRVKLDNSSAKKGLSSNWNESHCSFSAVVELKKYF